MCLVCLFALFDIISGIPNPLLLDVIVVVILKQQLISELSSHIYKFAKI